MTIVVVNVGKSLCTVVEFVIFKTFGLIDVYKQDSNLQSYMEKNTIKSSWASKLKILLQVTKQKIQAQKKSKTKAK